MPTIASGLYTFEDTPTVNGLSVMLTGGGTGTITTGTLAARPAAGTAGNLYIDTTSNYIWHDTGTTWDAVGTGRVLQTVTGTIARTTGTTVITTSVTAAPTITDGFNIWTQSFTPISASSKIIISFTLTISSGNANRPVILSVFAGNTNIGSAAVHCPSANLAAGTGIEVVHSPGSTAAITFTARIGTVGAATLSVEQYNGTTNNLGNAAQTEYVIQEVL